MIEKVINLDSVDPVVLFGINNSNYEKIAKCFSNIRIIARGDEIKLCGEEKEIVVCEEKIRQILLYISSNNGLSENELDFILGDNGNVNPETFSLENGTLLIGSAGKPIRAFTPNQKKMVASSFEHDLIFAIGPAGTGKTYTAIALAVRALKNREIKKIILSRPAVEAGESLGYLPGDLKEKLDPYLQPLYDALQEMIPPKKLKELYEDGVIEIAPLAFMRGRTLDNAYVILDEAQNSTTNQLKMFLTRMGKNAKFIVTGDITQIDLPRKQNSGLVFSLGLLKDIPGIAVIEFDASDNTRHKLVKRIVDAYEKFNESEAQ